MEQLFSIDVLQVDVSVASLGVVDFYKGLVNQNLSSSFGRLKLTFQTLGSKIAS